MSSVISAFIFDSRKAEQRYGLFLYVPNFLSFVNDNLIFLGRFRLVVWHIKAASERKSGKDLEMTGKCAIFVPIKLLDDIMCYEKGVSKRVGRI